MPAAIIIFIFMIRKQVQEKGLKQPSSCFGNRSGYHQAGGAAANVNLPGTVPSVSVPHLPLDSLPIPVHPSPVLCKLLPVAFGLPVK
jgi:hypothetical protein